ncbi:hypothetical protein [Vibrio chagasii]|uniref:hypothetical protein n=1 Tax=Vibrio chagasii TaxID=170679 RepID=UPI0022845510|nr:hypothetical protein [Vibrio chagasii]MCY9828826.1 hypothetical protein [Vibrio chagasii]
MLPVQRVYQDQQRAVSVQDAVTHLKAEGLAFYHHRVLTSRCLPQATLSNADITQPASDGLASYQVSYRQDSQPNTQPRDIVVEVTLDASLSLDSFSYYLTPDEILPPSTLRFYEPIIIEQPDWSGWNRNTGCFEYSL